ncbi:MAG: holo-ACP synthase [Chitinispirillaceae bacterium]
MFRGVGIDIVDIDRISKMVENYGHQFLEKIYTLSEIEWCSRKAFSATHYAGRWAAKEAFYKALPDHLQPLSGWKSIQVLPNADGRRPIIDVCDDGLKGELQREFIHMFHLSISHEKSHCAAIVILE